MRRTLALSILVAATGALGGCAVIGDAADGLWSGTKSAARFVSAPVRGLLRDAPEDEVVFVEAAPVQSVATETSYAAPTTAYSAPTSYSTSATYAPAPARSTGRYYSDREDAVPAVAIASPSELSFVRLNGPSDVGDWRTCENLHRGYWLVDAAGGRVNPTFEVCMRNKGYVRESELAMYGLGGSVPVRGSDVTSRRDGYTVGGYVTMP